MTDGRLSRQAFLARSGRIAAAAGIAGFVSLDPLAAVVSAAGPLRKCISLGGPGSLRMDGHPDD